MELNGSSFLLLPVRLMSLEQEQTKILGEKYQ